MSFSKAMKSHYEPPVYKTRAERLFQQQMGVSLAEDIVSKIEAKEAQLEKDNEKMLGQLKQI